MPVDFPQRTFVDVLPGADDAYWIGGDALGYKGVKFPDLKLYQLDADTLSLENIAGGTYKNLRLGGLYVGTQDMPATEVDSVHIWDIRTITDNLHYAGLAVICDVAKTSGVYTSSQYGAAFEPRIGATNTQNWTENTYGGQMGVYATNNIQIGATGTLTKAVGVTINCDFGGMTTTSRYGMYIYNPYLHDGAVITNLYQIYIEAPTAGSTLNYSIYSAGGLNYFAGHTGIGAQTDTTTTLYVTETWASPAESKQSLLGSVTANMTTGASANNLTGVYGQVTIGATNTQNWTNATAIRGIRSQVRTVTGATGTITGAVCFYGDASIAAATVTNLYTFYAADATGAGTVTNAYGLYIEAITKGSTLNYAIYAAGGLSYFASSMGIGTTPYAAQPVGSLGVAGGVMIGVSSTNNLFDDASTGGGTTAMYIGNAQITVASDIRIKTDISPTAMDALTTLRRLHVIDFSWNDPSDRNPYGKNSRGRWTGISAQELAQTVPYVVNTAGRNCTRCLNGLPCSEHGLMFVEYEQLVPVLVKAIQELSDKLADLEARRN